MAAVAAVAVVAAAVAQPDEINQNLINKINLMGNSTAQDKYCRCG